MDEDARKAWSETLISEEGTCWTCQYFQIANPRMIKAISLCTKFNEEVADNSYACHKYLKVSPF